MRYTFGTSGLAAQRLQAIAGFFNPLALDFIRKYLDKPAATAIDLGCGPGYTTDMLAKATFCKSVYGIDLSADFLNMAKKAFPAYHFLQHDVTSTPFPVHGNVAYARFLLAHLKAPCSLIDRWSAELEPNGLLFIEEVEDIFTENAVFKKYLEINTGLVAAQGASLYAGQDIKAGQYTHNVLYNEPVLLPVTNWLAATWFYLNTISIWQTEEYVRSTLSTGERDEISCSLKEYMESKDEVQGIAWLLRRVVVLGESKKGI